MGGALVFEGSANGAMLVNLGSEGHVCFHSRPLISIRKRR